MSYLPKLSPAVGKGLGGLPSRNTQTKDVTPEEVVGEKLFNTGVHEFVIPKGVYSISLVAVTGGEGGARNGGMGGRLAYMNNIEVIPGETLLIDVGSSGQGRDPKSNTQGTLPDPIIISKNNGGVSTDILTLTQSIATYGVGLSGVSNGGGARGGGGIYGGGGGGGAGGYTGPGGDGGSSSSSLSSTTSGEDGVGGAGGGGGGSTRYDLSGNYLYGHGGSGGGVYLEGIGDPGEGGNAGSQSGYSGGSGSSGGSVGTTYGGGGGGFSSKSTLSSNGRSGRPGAVRVIWPGNKYTFPFYARKKL